MGSLWREKRFWEGDVFGMKGVDNNNVQNTQKARLAF
jgi:hypothetical protein